MPRILRIINRLNIGGPTLNAVLLSKHLAPEFETLLVAGSKEHTEESSDYLVREQGLDYIEIPEMRRTIHPLNDIKAYNRIASLIRDFKPDIVHTHAAKAGAIGRLAAINAKVPVIVHTFHGHVFHSYFNPLKTRFFLQIERQLAKHSSAIIAISEKQKQELTLDYKVCKEENVKVIPLGFDLSKFRTDQAEKRKIFRQHYGVDDGEIAVGIVGRLVPVKNHRMFLKSVAAVLTQTDHPVRFFVIGDGELREELINFSKQLGLDTTYFPTDQRQARVTFTSWRKDVDTVMAGLDIVGLSSWNEGTPVSLIEAQAAGKAIVSTRVGGIENTVIEGSSAILVQPGDSESFTASLCKLIDDPSFRERLADSGWPFIEHRFHFTRLANETKELYLSLLNNWNTIY